MLLVIVLDRSLGEANKNPVGDGGTVEAVQISQPKQTDGSARTGKSDQADEINPESNQEINQANNQDKNQNQDKENQADSTRSTNENNSTNDSEQTSQNYTQVTSSPKPQPEYQQFSETELLSRELYETCREDEYPLELYVMNQLAKSIDLSYETETLKAQAVILRSLLYQKSLKERQALFDSASEEMGIAQIRKQLGDDYEPYMAKILEAILKTRGIVIKKDGEIVSMSYHAMSSGHTRSFSEDGEESVACDDNLSAENYISKVTVSEEKTGKLSEVQRDAQGYVELIKCDGEWVSGEKFRIEHGLASANFSWEKKKNKYYFTVRGIGHGYGLDQYYANELAKKGMTFRDILSYFDDEISFERME